MERLRRTNLAEFAAAWTRDAGGQVYLAAADYTGDPPVAPTPEDWQALSALPGASALHRADGAAHASLAARHRVAAAAPVRSDGEETLAVLLISGAAEPRPRALASLERVARSLAAPLAFAARLARLDAETRRLDRLASLGTLAGEIAHEVRNPLVSVKTFVQLLPERRDDPGFVDQALGVVRDELRRMERLLDLVIDYGRPVSAGERRARVGDELAAVGELLRHRAQALGVELESEVDPSLPDAALGADELRQVLMNLTLNAIDATPPGKGVRISAAAREDEVLLTVTDEGPGIPPELREALFRPFVSGRGERPGGLGLAITRRIVEEAGGSVDVADAATGGAELRVRLPAVPASPPSRG